MASWWKALAGALALLFLAQVLGLTDRFDRWMTDAHWQWKAARTSGAPFPPDIVVVGIDDRSVAKLGRLRYWSRAQYGQLIDRLRLAKAVGVDVLFTEPDRLDPAGDRALARSVGTHGRVVLPLYGWREARPTNTETQQETRALLRRLPRAGRGSDPGALVPVYAPTLQPPIPSLREAAGALGYADVNSDPDGVYRRLLLVKRTDDGALLPHFTVAIAAIAQGVPPAEALAGVPERIRLGAGRAVPLADDGSLWLQPIARRGGGYGRGVGRPVPSIPFVDALAMEPEAFRGKIVLVGDTATGTADTRPTPLDNGLRGVELNAEILANLLHLPVVRPLALPAQLLLVALALGVPLWLYNTRPPKTATAGAFVLLLALLGAMEAGFWLLNQIPSWAPVLIGLLGTTLLGGQQRLAQEEAVKRRLRERFSQYVAPQLVDKIVQDPLLISDKARRQHVAVLFSDIRNFTTYSEQHPPETVVRQMEAYLSDMTESVDAARGVLDKFIGDAVMAVFGPFHETEGNESAKSIACALDMLDRLHALNAVWAGEGLPPFKIGIGIHAGDVFFGEIGTERRMQLTALGDTVNLAARLQTATKELHATVIVSEAVKQEAEPVVGSRVVFEDRGQLSVRGRAEAVHVFEVRRSSAQAEKEQADTDAVIAGAQAAPAEEARR